MKPTSPASLPATPAASGGFLLAFVLLAVVLGLLFARSFKPDEIVFSSDGPLGAQAARQMEMPGAFAGIWLDLNWVGARGGGALPTPTYLFRWLVGPVGFAKFYAAYALLLLGLSAWLFLRQLGLRGPVCALGGLAAALNTGFFSYACWGLGTTVLCIASTFLALAALVTPATQRSWLKALVAGAATGMAVMEGFDVGAILSLFIAAFTVFLALDGAWSDPRRWGLGVVRVAVVGLMAAFIASYALTVLIGTQVKGVVGMEQDAATKARRWDDATQWSLPRIETLRVIIPGLFGYRMDTPAGGNYWGRVGERPGVLARHSGAGVYAGVLVVAAAFWALFQALRGRESVFRPDERRLVLFWAAATVLALLFAWGRHAPFYHLIYALPYFSTIRNPIKFMHPFSLGLVILCAYGLEGLARAYLERTVATLDSVTRQLKAWWAGAARFERRWATGCLLAVGASLVGWLMYAASSRELEAHLRTAVPPPELAPQIARFSLGEVGWFILFLVITVAVLTLIAAGFFTGRRARWAWVLLTALAVADLVRANVPWVYYWNRAEKYASNPVIDILRQRPWEHRVVAPGFQLGEQFGFFQQLYAVDWIQHQFPYYNVQSLDVVQEPRTTVENGLFRATFATNGTAGVVRSWELTSTRFVFALAGGFVDALNQQFDPGRQRFRLHTAFTFRQDRPDGPILVETNATGPFALLEFTGALPRARLYPRWQVLTNDSEALGLLANPVFNPAELVLVAEPGPPPPAASTNLAPGTVEFLDYSPKRIRLRAVTTAPSVLLLNDKFDPSWTVTVDGQPQPLLRCNFLMRGVQVPAGEHTVEFRFRVSLVPLGLSLAAITLGLGLTLGLVGEGRRRTREPAKA